jgi:hypothetical protein
MVLTLVLFWKALVLLNTNETPASTISVGLDINRAPWSQLFQTISFDLDTINWVSYMHQIQMW